MVYESAKRKRESFCIAGAYTDAVHAAFDEQADPANARGDYGQSGGHAFEQHVRQTFVEAREREDVELFEYGYVAFSCPAHLRRNS